MEYIEEEIVVGLYTNTIEDIRGFRRKILLRNLRRILHYIPISYRNLVD